MDQLPRSVKDRETLSKDEDYDSLSSNSLNAYSDVASDRSNDDGIEKPTQTPDERAWMRNVFLGNESIRLNHVLDKMEPSDIKNVLLGRLGRGDSKSLVALGILFPRSAFPYDTRQHCVRCHKAFDPLCQSSCVLSHPNGCVQKIKQDPSGAEFLCRRCSMTFRIANVFAYVEEAHSGLCDPCFKGTHTTDHRQIAYGDGLFQSCEDVGCVEFYV